jgi:cell division protein FtsI/penicillin-binding protein 2
MESSRLSTGRVLAISLFFGLALLGLVGRLAYVQLGEHGSYETLAVAEHNTRQIIPSKRGMILDRNGYPLALSVEMYNVSVDPRAWKDPTVADRAAQALGGVLQREPQAILQSVRQASGRSVPLASNVSYDAGRKLETMALPGVVLSLGSQRVYPEGDLASNLLGFVGADGTGLAGLELGENAVLAGKAVESLFQSDAFGNPIGTAQLISDAPTPGATVTLTIDRRIQQIAEQHLDAAISKWQADGGSAIAMDPQTGAILALVSRPSFRESQLNLNDPSQAQLYRDRSVSDVYEPGSTFKLITMSAAIDSGVVNANSTYDDTGTFEVGGVAIHNWDFSAHGITSMTTVIADSLNTGAAWVSQQLGAERFYDYVQRFGFGKPTDVGMSGEAAGIVRTPQTPGWSVVDLATNAYGQGIAVTPVQMITAIAAVMNGGKLMRPYIVQAVADANGTRVTQPTVVRQVISSQTSAVMRGMMQTELQAYTLAQVPGYTGGGKSGTSYIAGVQGYASQRTIPSYAEFVPYKNPRILLLVSVDDLDTNALGGVVAAPLARDILEQTLPILGIAPDRSGATPP